MGSIRTHVRTGGKAAPRVSARAHLHFVVHTAHHVHGRVPVCTSGDEPVHGAPGGRGQDGPVTRHGSARGPGHRSAREVLVGGEHHARAVAGPTTEPPTQPIAVVTPDGPGHQPDTSREAARVQAPESAHGLERETARDRARKRARPRARGRAGPHRPRARPRTSGAGRPPGPRAPRGAARALRGRHPGRARRPAAHGRPRGHRRRAAAAAGARPGDRRADHGLLARRRAGPLRRARRRDVRRAASRPRPGADRAPRARDAAVHRR